MAQSPFELPAARLRATIDPEVLPFEHTGSLGTPPQPVLGQDRAREAITFGMGMRGEGYHVFVAGQPKTGRTYMARTLVEARAGAEKTPPDWCYVNNFQNPDEPRRLRLSAGKARPFKKEMQAFVAALHKKIPEVLESEAFGLKVRELQRDFEKARRTLLEGLSERAREEGFVLQVSQSGMAVLPATPDGQPMSQEAVADLDQEEKEVLRHKSDELQREMKRVIKDLREAERRLKEETRQIDRTLCAETVEQLMGAHFEDFRGESEITAYLERVEEDILQNPEAFKKREEQDPQQVSPFAFPARSASSPRYEVNILVDHTDTAGAPVLMESNPTYPNLFGTVERQAWFGALLTDFTMIKPGALHKANGGYLVIKAMDLLRGPFAYDALLRALEDGEIRIEDPAELYGLFSTRTIRPEPIPLDLKIVLVGDPSLFDLLHFHDPRFRGLFQVKAHLEDREDRGLSEVLRYAEVLGQFCREKGLRHVDRAGVARLLESGMERTEDSEKLSLEIGDAWGLVREADHLAGLEGAPLIGARHIEDALGRRLRRANLVEERIREFIRTDMLKIVTSGRRVGQINGLSILATADHEFGKPSRITAAVSVGREGVIAIEKESRMSGNIHTKGVMILTGFLRERFARDRPISLTATLCFEQSYGMVEGDSASSAELYALLSALADVPLAQGIAVTGSVSQKGEIQAVGGLNRKIEAFYEICRERGLSGDQGVIIPGENVRNLMLKREIQDAVQQGLFHVWPILVVEEGIPILTGMEAGVRDPYGSYPEGSFMARVDERLAHLGRVLKAFGKEDTEDTIARGGLDGAEARPFSARG